MSDQDKKIQQDKDKPSKKDEEVKVGESTKNTESTESTKTQDSDEVKEKEKDKKQEQEPVIKTVVVKGKKKQKKEPFLRGGRGQAHINSSYNNTIITMTDLNGAVLAWSSAGKCGFKGPKKSTPYAASVVVKALALKIKDFGIKEIDVFVKGVGLSREAAVRAFGTNGIQVASIKDVTSIPHGGCRPKGQRRV